MARRSRNESIDLDRYMKSLERSHPWLFLGALSEDTVEAIIRNLEELQPGMRDWRPSARDLSEVKERLLREGPPKVSSAEEAVAATQEMISRSAAEAAAKMAEGIKRPTRARKEPLDAGGESLVKVINRLVSRRRLSRAYALVVQPGVKGARKTATVERVGRDASEAVRAILQRRTRDVFPLRVGRRNTLGGVFKNPRDALICAREIASNVRQLDEANRNVGVTARYGVCTVSALQMGYPSRVHAALTSCAKMASSEGLMSLTIPATFNLRNEEAKSIFAEMTHARVTETKARGVKIEFEGLASE